MTAPERLAKVAEAAREVRIGPFGPNAREIINRGGVTHLNGSEREALAQALAPLLDEFQAEDREAGIQEGVDSTWHLKQIIRLAEARGAARVREAVEAVLAVFEKAANDSPGHVYAGPWLAMVDDLRAALDAAEKAADGGVAGVVAGEDVESGALGQRAAEARRAAREGDEASLMFLERILRSETNPEVRSMASDLAGQLRAKLDRP